MFLTLPAGHQGDKKTGTQWIEKWVIPWHSWINQVLWMIISGDTRQVGDDPMVIYKNNLSHDGIKVSECVRMPVDV